MNGNKKNEKNGTLIPLKTHLLKTEWRVRMLASGIPVEILPVPESVDPVPAEAESVPSEPKYDHLTATPKAVQLELNLF